MAAQCTATCWQPGHTTTPQKARLPWQQKHRNSFTPKKLKVTFCEWSHNACLLGQNGGHQCSLPVKRNYNDCRLLLIYIRGMCMNTTIQERPSLLPVVILQPRQYPATYSKHNETSCRWLWKLACSWVNKTYKAMGRMCGTGSRISCMHTFEKGMDPSIALVTLPQFIQSLGVLQETDLQWICKIE